MIFIKVINAFAVSAKILLQLNSIKNILFVRYCMLIVSVLENTAN